MNTIYRIVWSDATQSWVAVSEVARTRGKRSATIKQLVATGVAAAVLFLGAMPSYADTAIPSTNPGSTYLLQGHGDTVYHVNAGDVYATTSGDAIQSDASAKWIFTNNGTISGAGSALNLSGASGAPFTVTNNGVINAASGNGIRILGGSATIFNNGTVSSTAATGTASDAAIYLWGAGGNTVTLGTGSHLDGGSAHYGLYSGSTNNAIVLAGSGSEDDNFLAALNKGFARLTSTAGSNWALTGSVTMASGSAVQVDGDLTLGGSVGSTTTTISNGGTLRLGTGGTSGSVSGPILDNGTLVINRSDNFTLPGAVSGTGSLVKTGTGTLSVGANTSYTGSTMVSGGTIDMGSNDALRNSSAVSLTNGSSVVMNGAAGIFATLNNLSGDSGTSVSNFGDIHLANSANTTYAGTLAASSPSPQGVVYKEGPATLTLTGSNAYTWRGLQVNGGTLEVATGGRLRSSVGGGYIANTANDATMRVTGSGSNYSPASLYIGGAANGAGHLEVLDGGSVTSASIYAGYASTGANTLLVDGAGSSVSTSGTLSVGQNAGTRGSATVSNGGQLLANGLSTDSAIGFSGTGALVVDGGGLFRAANTSTVGTNASAAGSVIVDGAGSAWQTANQATIGGGGAGDVAIRSGGTMQATSVVLGKATTGNGTLALTDGGTLLTGQLALGAGSGSVNLDSGTLRAIGDNASFLSGFGSNDVNLQAGGGVIDSNDFAIGSTSALTGIGALTKAGAGTLTLRASSDYQGGTNVRAGTLAITDSHALGSGTAVLESGTTLAVAPTAAGDFTFSNVLSSGSAGAGQLRVDLSNASSAFAFGASNAVATGAGFSGTVALGNSTFVLQNENASALKSATLEVGIGNVTTVGDGDQQIGGLAINGGTLKFNAMAPDQAVATSHISAHSLDANHAGTVQIILSQPYTPSPQDTPNAVNLLRQDDANIGTQLIKAGSVTGSAGNLALADQNGNLVSAAQQLDIAQGGNTVAKATYDYRLTTAPNDGLYVNYGLKQLDLQAAQTLTLAEDTGATAAASDMSAQIIGTGNLAIDAGAGTVSLSNTTNSYSGDTTVGSGTLRTDVDHALGNTTTLHIANTATTDLNGTTQTIQQLDGQAGSTLNIDGGTLSVANGGTSGGSLTGTGQLNVNGGTLDVRGANTSLTANTTIAAGATAHLNDTAGLGGGNIADAGTLALDGVTGVLANAVSGAGVVNLANDANVNATGDNSAFAGNFNVTSGSALTVSEARHLGQANVADDGKLVVNTATDWILANAVSGAGDLVKQGAGALSAGDALTYTGKTAVEAGTLIVGDTNQPNVNLGGAGAGPVTVAPSATLAGQGTVSGQVVNAGTVAALNALPGHAADAAGSFTLANGLVNSGTVNLAAASANSQSVGNQLAVKGDYVGNNGKVILNTVLGDDSSTTDKLVVDGGRALGNTDLVIRHAGGNGAQTNQGIRVVETRNGATTDATAFALSPASDGYRAGVGTIAAGAYDYNLKRGGNGGVANDWYLGSLGTTCDSNSALCQVNALDNGAVNPALRPEVGAYLNNRVFAQTMQFHTLHERQSQVPGMEGKSLSDSSDANAWVRVMGTTSSRKGALSASDTSYMVHAGGDVVRFSVGDGSVRLGVMGAYGSSNNRADNGTLSARGTVDGYNAGVYGTWYGNREILSGPYVDSWIMYGAFNNKVNGQGLPTESYKSSNLAASLEGGYSFPIYKSDKRRMFIEPQGQIIVSDYRADAHTEHNGTVVSGQSGTAVTTRLGVRVHGDVKDEIGKSQIRPFAEVNWWRGPGWQSATFDGVTVSDGLPANRLEGKVGLQGNVTKAVSAWGSVGFETGTHDYAAGKAQVGIKYSW